MVGLSQKRLKQRTLGAMNVSLARRDGVRCRPSVPCLSLRYLVTEAAPIAPPPHIHTCCSVRQTRKQVTPPLQLFPWAQGGSPGKRDHSPQPSNNPGDRAGGCVTPIAEMTMFLCVYRMASVVPRGTFPREYPGLASCIHSASSADDQREPCHFNFGARHPGQLKKEKRPAQPESVQPSTKHASHSHLVFLQSPTLE